MLAMWVILWSVLENAYDVFDKMSSKKGKLM